MNTNSCIKLFVCIRGKQGVFDRESASLAGYDQSQVCWMYVTHVRTWLKRKSLFHSIFTYWYLTAFQGVEFFKLHLIGFKNTLKSCILHRMYLRFEVLNPWKRFGEGNADSSCVCLPWWHRCNSCLTHLDTAVPQLEWCCWHHGCCTAVAINTCTCTFTCTFECNLYCLGKADYFRLKGKSSKLLLFWFCFCFFILNLLLFIGFFLLFFWKKYQ